MFSSYLTNATEVNDSLSFKPFDYIRLMPLSDTEKVRERKLPWKSLESGQNIVFLESEGPRF